MNIKSVREYARRGCPTSLRGKLWSAMLNIEHCNWVKGEERNLIFVDILHLACDLFQLSQTKCDRFRSVSG